MDEIYSDMVDIYACSLIFNRPWQYNVDATYLGRDNLYKINKNGVNNTFIPLKREPKPKDFKVEGKQLEAPIVRVDDKKGEKGFHSWIIHS